MSHADDADTTRYNGPRVEGPEHASPYPVSRLAPVVDLVDTARQIQRADSMLAAVVDDKLRLIADQIQALQKEAHKILEKARHDALLHRAVCRFERRAGHTYHLYRGRFDKLYLSILSPDDWHGKPPDAFEGSYRLEADQSWTDEKDIPTRDARDSALHKWLAASTEPHDRDP